MHLELYFTDLSSVLHLECPCHRSQVPNRPEIDRAGLKADLWKRFLFLHVQNQSVKFLHGHFVFGEIQNIALGVRKRRVSF